MALSEEELRLLLVDKVAIGGLLALAGFFLNRWLERFKSQQTRMLEEFRVQQARLLEVFKREQDKEAEQRHWQQAREDEIAASRRSATAELTKNLAAGNHNISWLTWRAKYHPDGVTANDLSSYDQEMHKVLVDLVSSRVTLAAIDEGLHHSFTPLVKEIYNLDARVARTAGELASSPQQRNEVLGEFHQVTLEYDEKLLGKALAVIASTQGLRQPSGQAEREQGVDGRVGDRA